MRLLLIRHAESQGNFEHRLQGRREFPLTAKGTQQAEALASRLAPEPLATIYSSPIGRALQTAEIIAAKARSERHYLNRESRSTTSAKPSPDSPGMRYGNAIPRSLRPSARTNRSSRATPAKRAARFSRSGSASAYREITARHNGDSSVAVVTHAGPITVLVLDALSRPYSRPIPFVLDNASITTIEINNGAAPHLPSDGGHRHQRRLSRQ